MAAGFLAGGFPVQTWSLIDGSAGTVGASKPFAAVLSGFAARPPWAVVGVDFGAGLPVGQVLKTVGVDTPPANVTPSAGGFTVTANNVTIDGWDFTDLFVSINNNVNGTIIKNSKFAATTTAGTGIFANGSGGAGIGSVTVQNCEFDGGGVSGKIASDNSMILYSGLGLLTVTYCYFHHCPWDAVRMNGNTGAQSFLAKYNLFYSYDYNPASAHSDCFQPSNGFSSGVFQFNFAYQPDVSGTVADGSNIPGFMNSMLFVSDLGTNNATGLDESYNTAVGIGTAHGNLSASPPDNSKPAFNYPAQTQLKNSPGHTGILVSPVHSHNYYSVTGMIAAFPATKSTPMPVQPTGGTVTNGSAVITNLNSTTGIVTGDPVSGTGIPVGAKVLTKDSATQITLDTPATASNTGVALTVLTTGDITDPVFAGNINMTTGAPISAPW